MYLPDRIDDACVLVTVKTYPKPSGKYGELVCTAGLLDGEKWIRVYPVAADLITRESAIPKYSWVHLALRRKESDFRPESYTPVNGIDETISVDGRLGTAGLWSDRRHYVEAEVFESMSSLIDQSKHEPPRSLATLRPREIVDFTFEPAARDWKDEWLVQSQQGNMFSASVAGRSKARNIVQKLPYNYYYKFLTVGDTRPRRLSVEDWEVGALYWKCLRLTDGDEAEANRLVRRKYFDELASTRDVMFFVGTTLANHWRSPNPFLVVGVFYPPKSRQGRLL